jgi:hypothetical protein
MELQLIFSASGTIKQTVRLNAKAVALGITPKRLQSGLNSGKYVTTVQEGGTVEITATGEAIGAVVGVVNEMEYEQFEVAKT